MRVLFTARAEAHLDVIYAYIARQAGEARADAFVQRIIDYCAGFAIFPERGTCRDDLVPGLRTIGFERSVTIAFLIVPDTVLIEGVYYGGQNYESAPIFGGS
ncbi:type II toxin-antitoxin system RelE/ParE family toxin [Acidisoma silvae]|uniref:Type II toxin-antitoxin system RelE/ParE family toxin n=1 Tax=Acidisoma silvae TaxID=2802396 RepID=A0A963YQR7_9PROT|nr:type II toxin-antitoxin system RelE/ParE family toxin [Acidisoma silvae]MCB8875227.1 type II toxin-antitoxin system RelE/ParE family toxin [Acidisoma silvae]